MKSLQVTKKTDFSGETIYVGMDVHKKNWTVTLLTSLLEHKTFVQPPLPTALAGYLKKHFPNATYKSTYEAGFCGFWIHEELKREGIDNIVINGADVPTTNKEMKGKRDPVDSRKLAKGLRAGFLQGIYVPSRQELEIREAIRFRSKLVKDITRTKNRIKGMLNRFGTEPPEDLEGKNWSSVYIKWLQKLELETPIGTHTLRAKVRSLLELKAQKRDLEKTIIQKLTAGYKFEIKLLRKIPGVGLIVALTILSELGDTTRFKNINALQSYVGLVPNIYSSGEKEYVGNMTKRMNIHVQPVLIQAAWVAVKKDPSLTKYYQDLCKKMAGNKAIIRVARKLLTRIRHVLVNREEYQLMV